MKIQKHFYQLAILLTAVVMTALFPIIASAAGTASQLALSVTADNTTANVGDNITFTYVISNAGNSVVDNLTLTDHKLGAIKLNISSLAAGENITASAVYTINAADLPGPFQNSVSIAGVTAAGDNVTATALISIQLKTSDLDDDDEDIDNDDENEDVDDDDAAPTKAEVLKEKGVRGRGIEHAPGLQKPFNSNSHAANNAGGNGKDKFKSSNGHAYGRGHGGNGDD